MSYEVKDGRVQDPKKTELSAFQISELLTGAIPTNGTATVKNVAHALNMLMAEVIGSKMRLPSLAQQMKVADAFHAGLIHNLKVNAVVQSKVQSMKETALRSDEAPMTKEEWQKALSDMYREANAQVAEVEKQVGATPIVDVTDASVTRGKPNGNGHE
jgi:hypothetical protein